MYYKYYPSLFSGRIIGKNNTSCMECWSVSNMAIRYASGGRDVNHLDETYAGERPDILDNAFVIVEYPGGPSHARPVHVRRGSRWEQELVAVGDAGKVSVHVPGFMRSPGEAGPRSWSATSGPDWPVRVLPIADDPEVARSGAHHGASYLEHVALRDAILAGRSAGVTVDDGLWSVAMGVAAHQSVVERHPSTSPTSGRVRR